MAKTETGQQHEDLTKFLNNPLGNPMSLEEALVLKPGDKVYYLFPHVEITNNPAAGQIRFTKVFETAVDFKKMGWSSCPSPYDFAKYCLGGNMVMYRELQIQRTERTLKRGVIIDIGRRFIPADNADVLIHVPDLKVEPVSYAKFALASHYHA